MTPDAPDELLRVIKGYHTRGWYPAKWAHHPQPIKDLIRAAGFRPQIKQCFMNCQKLLQANELLCFGLDLVLMEGWMTHIIPVVHQWLIFEGEVLELTLPPGRVVTYDYGHAVAYAEVISAQARSGEYGICDAVRVFQGNPLRALWEQLGVEVSP